MIRGISGYSPQQNFNINGYGGKTGIGRGTDEDDDRLKGLPGQDGDDARLKGLPGQDDEDNIGKPADEQKKPGRKSSPQDCETCKNRKYQDGSDEFDVSFQTPQHVDPAAAGAAVRAHEYEHVANAYQKAKENDGKVLSVGVSIHTAVCPECGRVYVSGGVTKSTIATPTGDDKDEEKNPYDQQKQAIGGMLNTGMRANYTT